MRFELQKSAYKFSSKFTFNPSHFLSFLYSNKELVHISLILRFQIRHFFP
jgi:hypothetical protein